MPCSRSKPRSSRPKLRPSSASVPEPAPTPAAPSDPAPPRRPRTPDTEAVYSAAHALYVPEPPPKRPPAEVVRPHFDAMYRILGIRPRRPEASGRDSS
ncbi:MAG: hypothetical protein MZV65_07265 [Chromatiales bacterium]|nr:hypothetical protein [Chromatiales bacterium]